MSRLVTLFAFAALALSVSSAPAAGQGRNVEQIATTTPIKHVIYLMQENHSFDNYFGTYPGANGIPSEICMPRRAAQPQLGCVSPFHIGNRAVRDLSHSEKTFRRQFRDGRMDGFVSAFGDRDSVSMGHYDDRDIPFYWNIADRYVLFDRFFTSAAGGSVWNHLYWVTATPGNWRDDVIPPGGFGRLPTIFDRLEAKRIPWKFYVQNYDPTVTFRRRGSGDRGSQVVWVPLLDYGRFLDNPRLFSKIVDLEQFYTDLARNKLPAVSYIAPSGASEHPPGSIQAGERFVRTLITALMRSRAWNSTAFVWSYDDWGGWYDHVRPPRVDAMGYGFRAPTLLVSGYARRGYVDSTTFDFTSLLKFIEENWRLRPLADRDRKANSIASAFDFAAPPRAAEFVPPTRPVPAKPEPRRSIIYVAYAFAALVAGLVITGVAFGSRMRHEAEAELTS